MIHHQQLILFVSWLYVWSFFSECNLTSIFTFESDITVIICEIGNLYYISRSSIQHCSRKIKQIPIREKVIAAYFLNYSTPNTTFEFICQIRYCCERASKIGVAEWGAAIPTTLFSVVWIKICRCICFFIYFPKRPLNNHQSLHLSTKTVF